MHSCRKYIRRLLFFKRNPSIFYRWLIRHSSPLVQEAPHSPLQTTHHTDGFYSASERVPHLGLFWTNSKNMHRSFKKKPQNSTRQAPLSFFTSQSGCSVAAFIRKYGRGRRGALQTLGHSNLRRCNRRLAP